MEKERHDELASSILGVKMPSNENIGDQVRNIRSYLNYTQKEFSNYLCVDRMTIVSIEKSMPKEDISSDILFRLYFFCRNLLDSDIDNFLNYLCETLYTNVNAEILKRVYSRVNSKNIKNTNTKEKITTKKNSGNIKKRTKTAKAQLNKMQHVKI